MRNRVYGLEWVASAWSVNAARNWVRNPGCSNANLGIRLVGERVVDVILMDRGRWSDAVGSPGLRIGRKGEKILNCLVSRSAAWWLE